MRGGGRVESDILGNLVRRASLSMDLRSFSIQYLGKEHSGRGRGGKSEEGGSLTYPDLPPSIWPIGHQWVPSFTL